MPWLLCSSEEGEGLGLSVWLWEAFLFCCYHTRWACTSWRCFILYCLDRGFSLFFHSFSTCVIRASFKVLFKLGCLQYVLWESSFNWRISTQGPAVLYLSFTLSTYQTLSFALWSPWWLCFIDLCASPHDTYLAWPSLLCLLCSKYWLHG